MTSRRLGVALAATCVLTLCSAFGQGVLPLGRTAGNVKLSEVRQFLDAVPWRPAAGLDFYPGQSATVLGEGVGVARMPAIAQTEIKRDPPRGFILPRTKSADEELLKAIYGFGRPFDSMMIVADGSAWPAFVGAVPIAWVLAAVTRDRTDVRAALSIAMSEGVAAAASMGLKRLVGRPRPYTEVPSIVARSAAHRDGRARDPHSFPSGHAALSFSLATAVALESERWYVTVPVLAWASTVSLSRVWLGVHYPTDVLAGAILGGGAALGMHALARSLIGDEDENGVGVVQMTFVRIAI